MARGSVPGGFAGDGDASVLAAVHGAVPGRDEWPALTAAVELTTRAAGYRFLVLGSSRVAPEKGEAAARRMVADLGAWLERSRAGEDEGLAAQSVFVAADLLRLGGLLEPAADMLGNAAGAFAAAGDGPGVARCHLLAADVALAPWSSPDLLGLDPWSPDRRPTSPSPEELDEAEVHCTNALTASDTPRVVAAVARRRSRLLAARGDPVGAGVEARAAGRSAAESGDESGVHLAAMLEIAALARLGRPGPLRVELPRRVLAWVEAGGSPGWARSLGLVLRVAGRRALRDDDPEPARLLVTCGTEVSDRTGNAADVAAGLEEIAEVYGALNSRGPALGALHRALDRRIGDHGGWGARTPIPDGDWMQAASALGGLTLQYSSERDGVGLQWCRARTADLLARVGSPDAAAPREDDDLFVTASRRYAELPVTGARRVSADGVAAGAEFAAEMLATVAASVADSLEQAGVMAPLARALRARRDGREATAGSLLAEAQAVAEGLGPRGATLRVVALCAARRFDEARDALRAVLDGSTGLPARMQADLLVMCRAYHEARSVDGIPEPLSTPSEGPAPDRWRRDSTDAECAFHCGDPAMTAALAARGRAAFEEWFGRLDRDPFRSSATDDVAARQLYLLAADAALALGRVEDSFRHGDRLRSLPLLLLLAEREPDEPARRRWLQAATRWSTAYDVVAWTGTGRRATGDCEPSRAAPDAPSPTAALEESQLRLEAAESALGAAPRGRLPEPVDLDRLRTALPPGALLLQYLLAGDRLVIWALDHADLRGIAQDVDGNGLVGCVTRVHAAAARSRRRIAAEDAGRATRELERVLLGPVAVELRTHRRVIVVPSGDMTMLPWPVLPFDGGLLGDDHVLSVLPAASLLPVLTEVRRPRKGTVTVVGDPEATGLAPLPGTRAEAIAVAAHHGVRPLIGPGATRDAVLTALGRSRVVHLATHGLVSRIAPTGSAVVLRDGERVDIADLAGLRLDADLVVLSACDTGRGDVTLGGDVVGLARQLLAVGARAVVVSLWPLADRPTAVLMADMHEHLAAGATAADALSAAQRTWRATTVEEHAARWVALAEAAGVAPHGDSGTRSPRSRPPGSEPDDGAARVFDDAAHWAGLVVIGAG